MKNSSLDTIKEVAYTLTILALSVSLIVLVSWSGGVLNDIKNFNIKKHGEANNSMSVYSDSNMSEVFRFSENKIVSGYSFFADKIVQLKDHVGDKNYSIITYFSSDDRYSNYEAVSKEVSEKLHTIEPPAELKNDKKKVAKISDVPISTDTSKLTAKKIKATNKKEIK